MATLTLRLALAASAAAAVAAAAPVAVTVDGAPASLGSFSFPGAGHTIALSNGLFSATFDRDDGASGWQGVSVTLTSLVVGGVELAHNLGGDAADPDRSHSLYVDVGASGGARGGGASARLACDTVRVLRLAPDLAELAFVDSAAPALRLEHHVVVRAGVAGLYSFVVATAAGAQAAAPLGALRLVARLDRGVLDHAFSDERGAGQQPTSAYLALMPAPPAPGAAGLAWMTNGSNAPGLPFPGSNGGNLPAGVYSDFDWALYPAENVLFGHFGGGRAVFHVALSGTTGNTSAAGFGLGPHRQGLGPRRDAVVEVGLSPSELDFGAPAPASLPAGASRLFGPSLLLFASGDPADPAAMIAAARVTALAEISASRTGLPWMNHSLYAGPGARSTVVGFIELNDARGFHRYYALLARDASGNATDAYALRSPTLWAIGDLSGKFVIEGVPQADDYSLFLFVAPPVAPTTVQSQSGSVTDVFVQRGVGALGGGGVTNLGTLQFTPSDAGFVRIWRIGWVDGLGGELGLGNASRAYGRGAEVPADLVFQCDTFDKDGAVIEGSLGQDPDYKWPYAMTKPGGTWLVQFQGGHTFVGNVSLWVVASMVAPGAGLVAHLNGVRFAGELVGPGADNPIAREALRGARAVMSTFTVDASLIVTGTNNVTLQLTGPVGGGVGFDSIIFAVYPHQ